MREEAGSGEGKVAKRGRPRLQVEVAPLYPTPKIHIGEIKPWIDLGVSRATWYNRQREVRGIRKRKRKRKR